MNEIDKVGLQADLTHLTCALRHHPDDPPTKAINYLCQQFGVEENEVVSIVTDELILPICKDCQDSLASGEWAIMICANCTRSKWIWKIYSLNEINWTVRFIPKCPGCITIGELYQTKEKLDAIKDGSGK